MLSLSKHRTSIKPFDKLKDRSATANINTFDESFDKLKNRSVTVTTAYTYILQCANGQYYVGSTTDLDRRMQEHQAGLGAKFTRAHLPVKLVYKEEYSSIEMAFTRERQLHGWSRAKKEALIKGELDSLKELSTKTP